MTVLFIKHSFPHSSRLRFAVPGYPKRAHEEAHEETVHVNGCFFSPNPAKPYNIQFLFNPNTQSSIDVIANSAQTVKMSAMLLTLNLADE